MKKFFLFVWLILLSLLLGMPALAVNVPGTNGQTGYNNNGAWGAYTLGGTCASNQSITGISNLGVITCSPVGGVVPGGLNGQVQYNNDGVFGGLTNQQLTALINNFSNTLGGTVPASGGGASNFLRADGSWAPPPSGTGTVTSVGMTGDNVIYNSSVTGSPITISGTLIPSLKTQTANTILAGPSSGSINTPAFRTLVGADLPTPTTSSLGGIIAAASATANQFLTYIDTAGTQHTAQPSAANLSNGTTGTGSVVLSNSPALVSPSLGTPASGVATNLTGTAAGLTAGNVSTINGLVSAGSNITITGSGTSGSPLNIASSASGGTVTNVSVINANGLTGTVANQTTTPQITLGTTVTGLLKGNGTSFSAATADVDYQSPITLTTTGSSGPATFVSDILNIPNYAGGSTPAGVFPQLQYNNSGSLGALLTDTNAAFKAHNTVENGLSFDPRDSTYGALCDGYNTFAGNSSQTTFTYTIPFTGSSSTDNTNFMVFYEPTNGSGSATILTTSQFTVTGVNSGSGGTITLTPVVPTGDTLIVVHDDGTGIAAAATAAVASGGYVAVPDGCTIYSSQANGTQIPNGAQFIGQGFTPNYGFQGQGIKPIMRVIAPTGAAPNFGLNVSGVSQAFFEGFEITTNVPGANSLGFLAVPVLIGANGSGGAGGAQSPGIVAQYMTFNAGGVGFGSPIGGNSAYVFSVLRFDNFVANNAGMFGPVSDWVVAQNDFSSNGAFGTYGSAGGMIIGPTQGAAGAASAGRIESNRFEYNLEGIVVQAGGLINMEGNQFDGNTYCGLDLNTFWSAINITGGWFRGNANGGAGGSGSTSAGKDAHICFNGGSGSGGLHLSNVNFYTNYSEGYTNPLGTAYATSPPYVLDFHTAAANNNDVTIDNGEAQFVAGNNGASVTDFAIYRNGRPTNLVINKVNGQPDQGGLINGAYPALSRGLPNSQWSAIDAFGDIWNSTTAYSSPIYTSIMGNLANITPTVYQTGSYSTFDCDLVNTEIIPNYNPVNTGNPMVTWLPGVEDPTYGAGAYTAHLTDTSQCRLGALTWMTVPQQYKVYGQAGTQTGTWTNGADYGGLYSVVSDTNASTLALTTTTYGGPIYLWFLMQGSNGGTFTYQLDSGPVSASIPVQGQNAFTFPISTSSQTFGGIRIPVTSAGSHTVTVTVTSATSSSNTVTIEGLGTPPGKPYVGGNPTVYIAGQLYEYNDAESAATAAFNQDIYTQASQLLVDGLAVNFVDLRGKQYVNSTTDMLSSGGGSPLALSATGQQHVADAFGGAIQFQTVPVAAGGAFDPRNYGAVCNATILNNNYNGSGSGYVTLSSSSNVIGASGYTFTSADVGKVISLNGNSSGANSGGADLQIPTTTILSVNTGSNTATIGQTTTSGTSGTGWAVFGHDDTAGFEAAASAAIAAGGYVSVPNNCAVRELVLPSGSVLKGAQITRNYGSGAAFIKPIMYILSTTFASDTATSFAINVSGKGNIGLEGFVLEGLVFPYPWPSPYPGYNTENLTGVGTTGANSLVVDGVYYDHMTFIGEWVGLGGQYLTNNSGEITFQGHNSEFINDGWGIKGNFEDSASFNDVFTSNFGGGAIDAGIISSRFIGDRYEENPSTSNAGAAVLLNGASGVSFDGCQWQFNSGYGLELTGAWNKINITGGWMEGNGTSNGSGHSAHIALDGASAAGGLTIHNVAFQKQNFAGGGNTAYIIDGITSGANNPNIEIIGGTLLNGYATSIANWEVSSPTNYEVHTVDSPWLRQGNTDFSINANHTVGLGTSSGNAGSILDASNAAAAQSSIILPVNTTSNRPASPTAGMIRYNSTLNTSEQYNGSAWVAMNSNSVIPNSLGGLTLSNDPSTPNTVIDIAAGGAASNDNLYTMILPAAVTKTTGAWTAGSGNGCLDTGTVAASTWYHIFLIENLTTGTVDELCSASPTSPTLPSGYTEDRRIGSILTNGSSNIVAFTQVGSIFYWATATLDINTSSLSTTAALETLNVPTGVKVTPICRYSISSAGTNSVILTSGDETDVAPENALPIAAAPGQDMIDQQQPFGQTNATCPLLTTNTSGQVRARASAASTTLSIVTRGWID